MTGTQRRTSRPIIVASLATIAALGLAGCSGGSGGGGGDAEGGPVNLSMYDPVAVAGPITEALEGLVNDCAAEQDDLTVEAVYSGTYAETMTKAQTAARSGEGPDIAVLQTADFYSLLDNDLIVPLNEISDDLDWAEDRFFEAFLDSSKDSEGNLYSIPFQRSTIVQYYNKDLFAAAGLDPETPPTTWEELEAAAEAIVDSGVAPKGIQIPSTQFGYWMLQALAIQAGVEVTDNSGAKTMFDDPAVVRALEYWKGLSDKGYQDQGTTVDWAGIPDSFLSGNSAIVWSTTGQLTNIRTNAEFDFGVSALPADERPGSPVGGGNLFIFQDADEQQRVAALELSKCLSSPENAAAWSVASGYVATGPEAWETDEMKAYVEEFPQAAVARDQLEDSVPELTVHEQGRVLQLANDAIASVMTDQMEPETALEELQEEVDGVLSRYQK